MEAHEIAEARGLSRQGVLFFFFQVLQKHNVEWRGGPKSLSQSLTEPRIQHLDSWLHKLERLGE